MLGRIRGIALLLALGLGVGSFAASQPARAPAARRVLIVSIDGLRPDALLRANAPAIRGLMQRGSYSMWARTTAVSVTLPSHVSMLTGVTPSHHHIEWNADLPLRNPIYPASPTLFELAKRAGYSTAMAVGKSKLSVLAKPGSLDWQYVPGPEGAPDAMVGDAAVRIITQHRPQVMLVHFPGVDLAGHDHGWGSSQQLAAVETADREVERLLIALRSQRALDSTVVFVTADHGGAGLSHGPDDPRSRTIPWIAAGPGIRKNLDLTTYPELTIDTENTFATACLLMRITIPQPIDGRAVFQMLEGRETQAEQARELESGQAK